MTFISGLRREMRVLALLLIVYFMPLTVASSGIINTSPIPNTITIVPPGQSSTTIKTSPTKIVPAPTATSTTATTMTAPTLASKKVPIKQTTPAPTGGRKFDGASFVGGIILGIVLTIICILAFKWWQSRNKSYHSL